MLAAIRKYRVGVHENRQGLPKGLIIWTGVLYTHGLSIGLIQPSRHRLMR